MAKSVRTRRQTGYELLNPIFVFLVSYKFAALNMKIMYGKLK